VFSIHPDIYLINGALASLDILGIFKPPICVLSPEKTSKADKQALLKG
jgi:hypothetical protein